MKKTALLVGLLAAFFISNAFAQIVTPSLDPSLPVDAPSAVSWRIGSTFGGSIGFSKDESASTTKDFYHSDTSVMLAYQPGSFISELFWVPANTGYDWDSSTDALTQTTHSIGNFKIALRGENRVSVGIGYNTGTRTVPVLGVSTRIDNTSYEGSFSMRLLNRYYLSAGLRRNSDVYPTGDAIKSNIVYGGAAALFGDPLGTVFRTEAAVVMVPRTTNIDLANVIQPKTTISSLALEVSFRSFLILYRYQSSSYESFNLAAQNKTEVGNRYGIGYKMGPLIFTLYGAREIESVGGQSFQTEFLKATFAYGFI